MNERGGRAKRTSAGVSRRNSEENEGEDMDNVGGLKADVETIRRVR
jgi:hypothetical protein